MRTQQEIDKRRRDIDNAVFAKLISQYSTGRFIPIADEDDADDDEEEEEEED